MEQAPKQYLTNEERLALLSEGEQLEIPSRTKDFDHQ